MPYWRMPYCGVPLYVILHNFLVSFEYSNTPPTPFSPLPPPLHRPYHSPLFPQPPDSPCLSSLLPALPVPLPSFPHHLCSIYSQPLSPFPHYTNSSGTTVQRCHRRCRRCRRRPSLLPPPSSPSCLISNPRAPSTTLRPRDLRPLAAALWPPSTIRRPPGASSNPAPSRSCPVGREGRRTQPASTTTPQPLLP